MVKNKPSTFGPWRRKDGVREVLLLDRDTRAQFGFVMTELEPWVQDILIAVVDCLRVSL